MKKPEEKAEVADLVAAELEAGFTTFAIDCSYMENELNLVATLELAQPVVAAGLGLEVEYSTRPHQRNLGGHPALGSGYRPTRHHRDFPGQDYPVYLPRHPQG